MKQFIISYHDHWEKADLETVIFANTALDAERIFANESDIYITDIKAKEV